MLRDEVQVEICPRDDPDRGTGVEEEVCGSAHGSSDGGVTGPRPKTFDANYGRYQKSAREEKKIAKRLGGRAQKRSGGLPWSSQDKTTAGGDITTPELHIEHKRAEPDTKSIGIKREWLAKVTEGAGRRMKTPAMVLHFERPRGHAEDWMLLPLDVAERLLAQWRSE